MTIQHNNQTYTFVYSDSSACWMSEQKIKLGIYNLDLEIYKEHFQEGVIAWDLVPEFLTSLNVDLVTQLDAKSKKILMAFWSTINSNQPIEKYRFELECIFFKGKHSSLIFTGEIFRFSLVYKLYHSEYAECFDPYGNYYIDVENGLITGLRREQI